MTSQAYVHTSGRLRERYGLILRPADYDHLCALIRQALPWLSTQVCGMARCELCVPYQGVPVRWVWDAAGGCLITALPMVPRREMDGAHFTAATRPPKKVRQPRRYHRRFRLEDEYV